MQVSAHDGHVRYAFQAGHLADGRVSILRCAVLPTSNGTDAGEEFLGPSEDKVFGCGVPHLYDGRRMRPEKLAAWQARRERYGNRDESRVDRGRLLPPAA